MTLAIAKVLLLIALICAALYFQYWMIVEGENVKKQQYDAIEDDYV